MTITARNAPVSSLLFSPRGPVSEAIIDLLGSPYSADHPALAGLIERASSAAESTESALHDDDIQLSLFMLYGISYGDISDYEDDWEWDATLIQTRRVLERAFERDLREAVPMPDLPAPDRNAVAAALFAMAADDSGPSLSKYVASRATREQIVEAVAIRTIYTLKEADPHSWAIPRLSGRAKAALVEIQADEYGGGRADRVHQSIFARTTRGVGLDSTYGAYVDNVPAIVLASYTMMSLFGLNRRLRGAIVGHLAAYEMTSSIPCALYARGFRRVGFGDDVADYFDEHVEADAVHEQIAGRDLAGGLCEDEPELLPDVFFGAAACLAVDGMVGSHILESWMTGQSALRTALGS